MVRAGDLITYQWSDHFCFYGLVVDVKESTELQRRHGVLYTFEILEENEKRFWYDVWKGEEDKIIVHNR